ncbi:SDR family NAD(P)-dependent oxidoreductase [Melghirimyces algeriensis]|uniref:3-oxoacyl-[acyl-carrier protein] reductase n=1 Tax=Melghirimyces algeriensis TaxID=910412 RepID=A0A521CCG8_9BACL|nr:SDR family oxidoreductase [Melghirimyces algeriensis]SMO56491.1 3-oxoacyl-[acyl-carrier protein] reductase [Melghirimyces algeriensis]
MDLSLKDKKVLVTGGSRGIGKAIAAKFVEEGAQVGIIARSQDELEQTGWEIGATIYPGDISNQQERVRIFNTYLNDVKRIDVLVNNAGASYGASVMDTDLKRFEEAMQLNFHAAVHFSKLAAEKMKDHQWGSIINISSIYGREAGGIPAYNASKAALISFTKAFSTEAIKHNIRVNGIAPGAIFHLNKAWKKRLEDKKSMEQYVKNRIPAGRFGTPEEIANVAVFLASDKASWIVGVNLNVDGGQSHLNF